MPNRIGFSGHLAVILTAVALSFSSVAVYAQGREEARLLTASQVLNEALGSPDQFVPTRLLERAYGIAVVPDVTKIAFFFGGITRTASDQSRSIGAASGSLATALAISSSVSASTRAQSVLPFRRSPHFRVTIFSFFIFPRATR